MAEADELADHVEQIVAACRQLPVAEQRHEVLERCQILYDLGIEASAIASVERQCLERLFSVVRPGDNWTLVMDGVHRHANVVANIGRGFWRCVDMETGALFVASDQCFLDRMPDIDDMTTDG